MNSKVFRKAVKDARVARGWSLERAAVEIGISRQALNYIERGLTKPRPLTRNRIAEYYGIDLREFESQSA
jgi:transcriptional regulator with XRE-family HTH domain